MTAPTYAWTAIADADIDPDSPLKGATLTNIAHNLHNLNERLGGSYTHEQDHDHDAINSAPITTWVGPNLIQNAMPENGSDEGWERSSVGLDDSLGHTWNGTGTEYAYQEIGGNSNSPGLNKTMFGTTGTTSTAGNPWVVSLYAKAAGATSGGTLRFGFADGSTSSYISGCRGDIAGTSLTTSWQRFYFFLTNKGSNPTTDLRLLMSITGTFGADFYTSGYMVHFGGVLMPFALGPLEPSGNDDYTGLSEDCAVWDYAIAYTNAVRITPV